MESECLVRYDEDWIDGSAAKGVHEGMKVPIDLGLGTLVDREWSHFLPEPLPDLVVPILKIRVKFLKFNFRSGI